MVVPSARPVKGAPRVLPRKKTGFPGEVAVPGHPDGGATNYTVRADCYARRAGCNAAGENRGREAMTDGTQDDSGLLGNLPNRRPGVESPRRAAAREAAARRQTARSNPAEPAETETAGGSGIGQLASAGIGLATGVAVAGVRLAGRAAGEIGKVVGGR